MAITVSVILKPFVLEPAAARHLSAVEIEVVPAALQLMPATALFPGFGIEIVPFPFDLRLAFCVTSICQLIKASIRSFNPLFCTFFRFRYR